MGVPVFLYHSNNKCPCLIAFASAAVSKKCKVKHFMTRHKDVQCTKFTAFLH